MKDEERRRAERARIAGDDWTPGDVDAFLLDVDRYASVEWVPLRRARRKPGESMDAWQNAWQKDGRAILERLRELDRRSARVGDVVRHHGRAVLVVGRSARTSGRLVMARAGQLPVRASGYESVAVRDGAVVTLPVPHAWRESAKVARRVDREERSGWDLDGHDLDWGDPGQVPW